MSNTTKQVNLALTIEEAKMLRKALGYYQMEAYVQKDDTTAESCMDLFQKIYACEKEAEA